MWREDSIALAGQDTTALSVADTTAQDLDTLSLRIIDNVEEDSCCADTSLFYKKNFFTEAAPLRVDSVPADQGIQGIPATQSFAADNVVCGLMVVCLLLTIVAIAEGRSYLASMAQSLFSKKRDKEGEVPRDETTISLWFLSFETCLSYAFILCVYLDKTFGDTFVIRRYQLIGLFAAVLALFFLIKAGITSTVNRTFFTASEAQRYSDVSLFLFVCEGLFLVPLVCICFSFDVSCHDVLTYVCCVFVLFRLLTIYKAGQIFFSQKMSFSGIFIYLCTLEAIPYFMIWNVLTILSGNLRITFLARW